MSAFTDELFAVVPAHRVLSDLLLVTVRPKGETPMRCVHDFKHRRGDRHRSANANGEKGLYICNSAACGLRGDVVKLAVELGYASTVPDAIHWLRRKYGLPERVRRWHYPSTGRPRSIGGGTQP